MSTTFFPLTVNKICKETKDTVSITFDVPAEAAGDFKFESGQYLTLKKEINGEEIRRSYSICSAPYENKLTVAVKEIENGIFSGYANNTLKEGDVLGSMRPTGNFKVETNASATKNYIFYAAGSGITPVISMVKSILKEEPNSNVQLYYGNKNADSTIFKTELDTINSEYLNLNLTYIYSQEETGSELTKGRIDSAKCEGFYAKSQANSNIDSVYACGPEEMIMLVKDFYLSKNVDKSQIHFELFTASASAAKNTISAVDEGEPITSEITVIIDDEEFQFSLQSNGKNILQAAQDKDADVPFSCKGGVCCTCRAKVLEGTVRMDLNFALEDDEIEDGFVLTCQAHPTSEKVVISYDEY